MSAWFAVHSKPQQEKRAADYVATLADVQSFLPEFRFRERTQPLFTSYFFVFCPSSLLPKVEFTRGVSYVVNFGGIPAKVPTEVIEEIKFGMDGGYCRPDSLRVNDEVVITSGPFAELRGVFQREISGTERAIILLNTLHRATVQISRRDLRHA